MKEYKCKFSIKLCWSVAAFCAAWFVLNLVGKFTHDFFISCVAALVIALFILFRVWFFDNFSIVLDGSMLFIKRYGSVIKSFNIDDYYWSEYSPNCNVKNAEDQYIYYVSKENGDGDFIDCSNFREDDYEQLLEILGAKNSDQEPIKVETIKK